MLLDREEMTEIIMPIMRQHCFPLPSHPELTFHSNGSNDKTEDTLVDSGMRSALLSMASL